MRTDSIESDAIAFTRPPKQTHDADSLLIRHEFAGTPYGAGLLAEEARESACAQGARWAADKAGRVAFAAAMWLLGNAHPEGGALHVRVEYNSITRMLVINVDDDGAMLPGQQGIRELPEPEWRAGAELPRLQASAIRTDSGRRLQCACRIREPYRIRITRLPDPRAVQPHPSQTYQGHLSQDGAEWSARVIASLIGSGEVAAVDIQGPNDPDGVWHPWTAD